VRPAAVAAVVSSMISQSPASCSFCTCAECIAPRPK
jgi:hypothetical protein